MSGDRSAEKVFPVQTHSDRHAFVPRVVYMAAYEVYSHVHGPQPALIEGGCRGGFGIGELTAFLYARPFPKIQWEARVNEAFQGMEGLA